MLHFIEHHQFHWKSNNHNTSPRTTTEDNTRFEWGTSSPFHEKLGWKLRQCAPAARDWAPPVPARTRLPSAYLSTVVPSRTENTGRYRPAPGRKSQSRNDRPTTENPTVREWTARVPRQWRMARSPGRSGAFGRRARMSKKESGRW